MKDKKSIFGSEHPYHKINDFLHSHVFAVPFLQTALQYYCENCTDEAIEKELKDNNLVAPELWKQLRDNAVKTL